MNNTWSLERRMGWYRERKTEVKDIAHPTMPELKGMLNFEADRMYHNASLLHVFPLTSEPQDLRVDTMFDSALSSYVENALMPHLSFMIKEKFGIDLTFQHYGRSGATIGPTEWVVRGHGIMTDYAGLDGISAINNLTPLYSIDWTNLTRYNALRKLLRILEFINDFWADQVEHCPEWWEEEAAYLKEINPEE